MSLAARFGLADPPGRPVDHRPAVVLEGDAASLETMWPVVDAALRDRPDYRLIIAVPPHEVDRVQRRFSHEQVAGIPHLLRRPSVVLVIKAGDSIEAVPAKIAALPAHPRHAAPAANAIAGFILRLMGIACLDTVQALRKALGEPETIICLGNGPTSRAASLDHHADATLFRVNWIWRNEPRLNQPHMVFTADPDVPPEGLKAILAFPDSMSGHAVLAQHLLALRPPRAGYVFADHFTPPVAVFANSLRPTNGAVMVAVAAALGPRKLVIGGIDLYRHPQGRYPESQAVDGYARGHGASCDLALIRHALSGFTGEVVHINPRLRAALDAIPDRSPAFPLPPSRPG